MTKSVKIFSPSYTLESMKSSGYKDAAHAIAELIDNSIQAATDDSSKKIMKGRKPKVEVICSEKSNFVGKRHSSQIDQIAVYDNAIGMDSDTLSLALAFGQGTRRTGTGGMGKFGFGLPNASISQCERVDVYSWQNGTILHTYLDSYEIVEKNYDEVPAPRPVTSLPEEWVGRISSKIEKSGTLVIWSKLARLTWRRHNAFFNNTEFLVGRMYRKFLASNTCEIIMTAFDDAGNQIERRDIKPNDPLYLMENTSTPDVEVKGKEFNFSSEAAFIEIKDITIAVEYEGEKYPVQITASEARKDFRRYCASHKVNAGSTAFGRHAARNQGISVIREGREIELNHSFEVSYDPVERFWGIEICFTRALDGFFGVTNNKQAATAFTATTIQKLADEEEISVADLEKELRANNDPRLGLLKISTEIHKILSYIRDNLAAQTKGTKLAKKVEDSLDDAVDKAARKTVEADGKKGGSDQVDEDTSLDDKKQQLKDELEKDGVELSDEDMNKVLKKWLESKFIFQTTDFRGSDYIFDVNTPAGKIKVTFNSEHLVYQRFIKPIEENEGETFDLLKLLFAAWARTEDILQTGDDEKRKQLEDIRKLWGVTANSMIENYEF